MSLTRLEMATEVLDNLGRDGAATTRNGVTLSDMAIRWLNRAQIQAARQYDMLYTVTTDATIADQANYSFPSTLRSLFTIRVEDGLESRKLRCVMPWSFDAVIPKPDEHTTSRPCYYIPNNATNTYDLYPIPDDAYVIRLRYSYWPLALASDSSTSSYQAVGIDADDATIALATSFGYSYLQELVDANKWKTLGDSLWKSTYAAHMASFPDWVPIRSGFTMYAHDSIPGEYYSNPFVLTSL